MDTGNSPSLFMVFDVESVGLHGEGFAVGYVVVDSEGNEHDVGAFACPAFAARGNEEGFKWIRANLPALTQTHDTPWQVRAAFWKRWLDWKLKGAVLVADCAWPVEARFLIACIEDNPVARQWQGPYPLHDLASVFLAQGKDPLATHSRQENELPLHDPLADARQSARLFLEALHAR